MSTSARPLEPTGSPPAPRRRSADTSSSLWSTSTYAARSGFERSTSRPRRTRTASPITRESSTERSGKLLSRRVVRIAKVRPGRSRRSATAASAAVAGLERSEVGGEPPEVPLQRVDEERPVPALQRQLAELEQDAVLSANLLH